MAELTLGSLFDGLGGWQLAALHNGVRPVWSSEIEAFPMAVTKKHFPDTLQLVDITKLDGATLPPVDIICAGSPCQDLSVAGKRKGLEGERSGLFRKAIDIVFSMREATNGEYPKFFIWENVPGAFSSNKGADFQAVLEEITKSKIPMPAGGKWAAAGMVRSRRCDIAWRVLDAQYWGVPQRRKRIFLIADFREKQSRNTEILFESESLPRNTASGENEGQGTAAEAENGIKKSKKPQQYAVDFGRTADRIQMEATKSTTLSAQGGGMGAKTGLYCLPKGDGDMKYIVRRLTPLEAERLQGFPDGYTDIEFKGKSAPDSARYKAIGNGMAQPCADFVLGQVVKALTQS